MSRGDPQILLRVSQELKNAIHAAAKLNKRSVNSELLVAMERTYLPKRRDALDERPVERLASALPDR